MKYLDFDPATQGAEDAEDVQAPQALLEAQVTALTQQLAQPTSETNVAEVLLTLADAQLKLERPLEAWENAKKAFDQFIQLEDWAGAVQACHALFLTEQSEALVALGNGIWLAVTFPIDPELSVLMLEHLIDETPDDADGAAVAAVTGHYLVDLRATGSDRENLLFFTNQSLAKVARRHSQVDDQAAFEVWFKKLELDSPPDFLGRLAQILDVLVQNHWWVDREALRARLPV